MKKFNSHMPSSLRTPASVINASGNVSATPVSSMRSYASLGTNDQSALSVSMNQINTHNPNRDSFPDQIEPINPEPLAASHTSLGAASSISATGTRRPPPAPPVEQAGASVLPTTSSVSHHPVSGTQMIHNAYTSARSSVRSAMSGLSNTLASHGIISSSSHAAGAGVTATATATAGIAASTRPQSDLSIASSQMSQMRPLSNTPSQPEVVRSSVNDYNNYDPQQAKFDNMPDNYKEILLANKAKPSPITLKNAKHAVWGSPRRKVITLTCLTIIMAIFGYLVARIVDALKIMDTSPSLNQLKLENLCSTNSFQLTLGGVLRNPSNVPAHIGNTTAVVKNGKGEPLAYATIPAFELPPGNGSLGVTCNVEIKEKDYDRVRETIQNWINGQNINYTIELPLDASFDANIFLFPVTISTTLSFSRTLAGYGFEYEYEKLLPDEYEPRTIKSIVLDKSKYPNDYVLAQLALNLWTEKSVSDSKADVTLPPLTFVVDIDGMPTALGKSQPIRYGKRTLPTQEIGVIRTAISAGWANIDGVQSALTKVQNDQDIHLKLKVTKNINHPDFTSDSACFIQNLFEGITFERTITYTEDGETNAPSSSPTGSYVNVTTVNITEVTNKGVIGVDVDANVQGLLNFYGLRGFVPPLMVYVYGTGPQPNTKDLLVGVTLKNGVTLDEKKPDLDDVRLDIEFKGASEVLRAVDVYTSTSKKDYIVYIKTNPSRNKDFNSVASAFLSAIEFEFVVRDVNETLVGRRLFDFEEDSRRMLAGSTTNDKSLLLKVASDTKTANANLKATGFAKDIFSNIRVEWQDFLLQVYAPELSNSLQYQLISNFTLAGFSTNTFNPSFLFDLKIFDKNEGSLITKTVTDYTDYTRLNLKFGGKYGKGPSFLNPVALQRASDVITSDQETSTSFFELLHAELLGLANSEFDSQVNFRLDTGETAVNVTLPDIAVGLGICGEKSLILSATMDPWGFVTGVSELANPLIGLELLNSTKVVNAIANYKNGIDQSLCLNAHPDKGNFVSKLIGAIGVDFLIKGSGNNNSPTPAPTAGNASSIIDNLNIVIVSDVDSACIDLSLKIDSAILADEGLSVGWGKLMMELRNSDTGIRFATITLKEGYIGSITAFKKQKFYAPNTLGAIELQLCVDKDPANTIDESLTSAKSIFNKVLDGKAAHVDITGSYDNRVTNVTHSITADFSIPEKALDKLMTSANVKSSDVVKGGASLVSFISAELLEVDYDSIDATVTLALDDFGLSITLPLIELRISEWLDTTNTESPLLGLSLSVPPFGVGQLENPVSVSVYDISSYNGLLDFYERFSEKESRILIGASNKPTANYLSRVIPDFKITYPEETNTNPTKAPTAGPVPKSLNVTLSASSDASSTTIGFGFRTLKELSFALKWDTVSCNVYDGVPLANGVSQIGTFSLQGMTFKALGSGTDTGAVVLSGTAAQGLALKMFKGQDVPVGIAGTIGSRPFRIALVIPKKYLSSIALGADDKKGDSSSSFKLTKAALLGGDNIGSNIVLPCLINGLCKSLIRDDNAISPTGVTAGITLDLGESQSTSSVLWKVSLNADLWIDLQVNGFEIMRVSVRSGLAVGSQDRYLNIVFSLFIVPGMVAVTRDSLTLFTEGNDMVVTVRGSDDKNHISGLLQGITQDFEFVSIVPDPNKPDLVGSMSMSLSRTTRTRLEVTLGVDLTWTGDLTVLVGDVVARVFFGHTENPTDVYASDASHVATANIESLSLAPQASAQKVSAVAALHFVDSDPQGAYRVNDLLSRFIWVLKMPLQILVDITPPPNPYVTGTPTSFQVLTFLTIPKGPATSGFIHSFGIDIGGTLTSSLGDVNIVAEKVVNNTLAWPIILSYFEYYINLIDGDGVRTGECNGILGGLYSSLNPCSYTFCYGPWATPQNIIETGSKVKSCEVDSNGNCNAAPNPLQSIVTDLNGNFMVHIPSKGLGKRKFTMNMSTQTAVRMWDEYNIKNALCANVIGGELWVAMQADTSCADWSGTAEKDLVCTYVVRIYFDLVNYALGDVDCGQYVELPIRNGFSSASSAGVYQHGSGNGGGLSGTRTITDGGSQHNMVWDNGGKLKITDSFEISFNLMIDGATLGAGEGFSLVFRKSTLGAPSSQSSPGLSCSCGFFSCDDCYAFKGLGNGHIGIIGAFYRCNSWSILKNGNLGPIFHPSESCAGEEIDNGGTHFVRIRYDAFNKRMQILFKPSNGDDTSTGRVHEFPIDLFTELGATDAYLGFGGSTGKVATATIRTSNFVVATTRTDSTKTALEKALVLPKVNQSGTITFRARDPDGRSRGGGGNTWAVQILVAGTSTAAPTQGTPSVTDLGDGTYRINYIITTRGRYDVKVACVSTVAPNNCWNAGSYVTITQGLFIRDSNN